MLREETELWNSETLGLGTPDPSILNIFSSSLPPAGDFAFPMRAPLPRVPVKVDRFKPLTMVASYPLS